MFISVCFILWLLSFSLYSLISILARKRQLQSVIHHARFSVGSLDVTWTGLISRQMAAGDGSSGSWRQKKAKLTLTNLNVFRMHVSLFLCLCLSLPFRTLFVALCEAEFVTTGNIVLSKMIGFVGIFNTKTAHLFTVGNVEQSFVNISTPLLFHTMPLQQQLHVFLA